MALSTFVGSFTVPNATGNQSKTGVGFQPKLVFFWGDGYTADGVLSGVGARASNAPHWGIGISSSSRVAVTEGDDGATGNPCLSDATKCIRRIFGATPTTTFAADFVSLDSDGFTLNWTTANATAYVVNYLALGGADLTNASLISFTSGTSTGNHAYTGVGFAPDAIVLLGADSSASNNSTNFGLGRTSSERGTSSQGANATTGGRIQRTNKVYTNVDGGSSVRCEADLVTLDSDGFTLNWTTVNANTHTIYALCLKGGSYHVGSFLQKSGGSGSASFTGVGFQPKALLNFSVGQTAGAALGSIQVITTSAVASTSQRASVEYSAGNFAVSALDRGNVVIMYADDTTPSLNAKADLTSFDSDGFTFNYTTSDATIRESIYLAIGNASAGATVFVPRNTYQAPILTQ